MNDSKTVSNMNKGELSPEEPETDIIERCIGVLGRWHIWIFVVVSLAKLPSQWHLLGIIFIAPPIDSYCVDNSTDKCSENCTAIKYDTSVFTSTITTEWHLICEKQYLPKLTQSMVMLGMMIGNIIFGHLADRYGRHPILTISVAIQAIAGTITAFSPCFTMFVLMKFITAMATGGTVIISTVFVIEMLGIKWRTVLGTLCHVPISFGYMLMVPISYYLRDWRSFEFAISAPSIILIAYYWILPESPRWQLAVGQKDEAIKTLKSIAGYNKLSTEKIENQVNVYVEQNCTQRKVEHKENLLDLFRSRSMCIYTLSIWFNWFVCGFCFYGLSQYVGHLSGNIFSNVFFSGLSQIPSILFTSWSTEKWGRKNTLILANTLAAITLISLGLVHNEAGYIKTILVTLCTFFTVLAFCTVYIYSIELFPTVFRNVGVGSSSMCARIGSIIAPFIATLSNNQRWLPPVVFGVSSLLGVLLCLKLPETQGCKLPESIGEVVNFEKKNRQKLEQA